MSDRATDEILSFLICSFSCNSNYPASLEEVKHGR